MNLKVISSKSVVLGVIGLTGLMSTIIVPRETRAESSFTETMGVSAAVGTVLGASTLPFYAEPGKHVLVNVGLGAAAGIVTGLAIYGYQWAFGQSDRDEPYYSNDLRRVDPQIVQEQPLSVWLPLVSFTL